MSFEMRGGCERCGLALAEGGAVFDCSYECTFCERCTARAPHDPARLSALQERLQGPAPAGATRRRLLADRARHNP